MTRRQTIEAVLFLPAMALLAAGLFAAGWVLIKLGGVALRGWFWLLSDQLALPRWAALALAVMAAALSVYALLYWLGRRKAVLRT